MAAAGDAFRQFVNAHFYDSESEENAIDFAGFEPVDALVGAVPLDLVNSAGDRDVVSDARIGCASDDGDGPMCAPFTGERKLLVDLPNNASPLHYFDMFFERDMWDTLEKQYQHLRGAAHRISWASSASQSIE